MLGDRRVADVEVAEDDDPARLVRAQRPQVSHSRRGLLAVDRPKLENMTELIPDSSLA